MKEEIVHKRYRFHGAPGTVDLFSVRWDPPTSFLGILRLYITTTGPHGVAAGISEWSMRAVDFSGTPSATLSAVSTQVLSTGSGVTVTNTTPGTQVVSGKMIVSLPDPVSGADVANSDTEIHWELTNRLRLQIGRL